MKSSVLRRVLQPLLAVLCLGFSACTTVSPVSEVAAKKEPPPVQQCVVEADTPVRAILAFYSTEGRFPAESMRTATGDPYLQMQQAIRYGQMRPPELQKALVMLDRVQSSKHPAAVSLSSLARLLHDEYAERLRLEQQLHVATKRADELQEKIVALSEIEVSLPRRPVPNASHGREK